MVSVQLARELGFSSSHFSLDGNIASGDTRKVRAILFICMSYPRDPSLRRS